MSLIYGKQIAPGTVKAVTVDATEVATFATGGTFTGDVNVNTPTIGTEAANKDYVDNATTIPTSQNKAMSANTTTADGQKATNTVVATTPAGDGYVEVLVNGVLAVLGNGVKTKDCYFSADNGSTARLISDIAANDELYWNGSIAGYELTTTDKIDFLYNVNGNAGGGEIIYGQGLQRIGNTVSVKVDGSTVTFNGNDELVASGGGSSIADFAATADGFQILHGGSPVVRVHCTPAGSLFTADGVNPIEAGTTVGQTLRVVLVASAYGDQDTIFILENKDTASTCWLNGLWNAFGDSLPFIDLVWDGARWYENNRGETAGTANSTDQSGLGATAFCGGRAMGQNAFGAAGGQSYNIGGVAFGGNATGLNCFAANSATAGRQSLGVFTTAPDTVTILGKNVVEQFTIGDEIFITDIQDGNGRSWIHRDTVLSVSYSSPDTIITVGQNTGPIPYSANVQTAQLWYVTTNANNAFAEGTGRAEGNFSHAEGNNTRAVAQSAHAEGESNTVYAQYGHGEGTTNDVVGDAGHAEGIQCVVTTHYGHAEGATSIAGLPYRTAGISGTTVTISGLDVTADFQDGDVVRFFQFSGGSGEFATADRTISNVAFSVNTTFDIDSPIGDVTGGLVALPNKGNGAHAEGSSRASGDFAHSEGGNTISTGTYAHSEGSSTLASGNFAHAEGDSTISADTAAHAEGGQTEVHAPRGHAEGFLSTVYADNGHAEGQGTVVAGTQGHAEGTSGMAAGTGSHVEGSGCNIPAPPRSFVFASGEIRITGDHTSEYNNGDSTFVFGLNGGTSNPRYAALTLTGVTYDSGNNRTVITFSGSIGDHTAGVIVNVTYGSAAHAEGVQCESWGQGAHSQNFNCIARGDYSDATGTYSRTPLIGQHAQGVGPNVAGRIGSVQSTKFLMRGEFNDDLFNELVLPERFVLEDDKSYFCVVTVCGAEDGNGNQAMYKRRAIVKRVSGTVSLVGSVDTLDADVETSGGWDVQVSADDTMKTLKVEVKGTNGTTVGWIASIEAMEVTTAA
jgi:hypothetical protein